MSVFRGSDRLSQTIKSDELVVGDIYCIEEGMMVPADSLVINGYDIFTDEETLTSEHDP